MIDSTLVTVVSKFIDFSQNYIDKCKFIKILSLNKAPWRNMQCGGVRDSVWRMLCECYFLNYEHGGKYCNWDASDASRKSKKGGQAYNSERISPTKSYTQHNDFIHNIDKISQIGMKWIEMLMICL